MPKVVKYRSLALENMDVNLEAFRKSHIGSCAVSRDHHLRKDMLSVTWMEKNYMAVCFLRSGNLH
jgi:hypothetical protein